MSTICRLCALPCDQFIDILGRSNGVTIPILQYKIKQLLDIAVGQGDNLPHSVCETCEIKLESLWCFINKCHQVQIQLRKSCKTIIRNTQHQNKMYPLGPSSPADLLGGGENSEKCSDDVSKKYTICNSANIADDTASVSNRIETTLIHTRGVNNCISGDDNDVDYNNEIEAGDNSLSIASEESSIDNSSNDPNSRVTSMNVSISNCEDIEMDSTNGADDEPSSTADKQSDKDLTEISPSTASTTSSETGQFFEGHYYRIETDMNSDLICNRIPYLVVESKMGTKHKVYTVSPDVSKFDENHDVLFESDGLGLYFTLRTYDFNNTNFERALIQWLNNLLKGEISLMPYYLRWLDNNNQPILGFKCVLCKRIIVEKNRQTVMNHIADHLLWRCSVCDLFFRNLTQWRLHFLQHDSVTLECTTCNKKFGSDYEKYKVHKRSHYKFECSSCRFKCSDEVIWLIHLKKDRQKNCSPDCCLFYENISEFQKHVSKISTVGGYVCGACGMAYHCEEYLKLHLTVHGLEHGSKPTSACNLAAHSQNEAVEKIDRIINSNEDVQFDMLKKVIDKKIDVNNFKMSSTAPGGRVFTGFKCFKYRKCQVLQSEKQFRIHLENHFMMTCLCKKSFLGLKQLGNHFRQHSFKGRMCVQCKNGTSAEYLEHLSLHQQRRICVHCQRVFHNSKPLASHVRIHNETQVGSHSEFKVDHSRERHPKILKMIVCEICGKNFNEGSLKGHIRRVHNKDNDVFICAYCSKEFSQRCGFVLHIKQHMNEKNFKCDICDKAFNRESSLRKHTLDMHSVKKHVCNECGRRFTYPSAMRDHMKRAHALVISARK